jgi:hypothetical protein
VLAADLAVRPDVGFAFLVLTEKIRGLSFCKKLVADAAAVQKVQGVFKENLQFFLIQPRTKILWIDQLVQLLDFNLFS